MIPMEDRFAALELLGFLKNGVRGGAIAITETSTPAVRELLMHQLHAGVQLHGAVFDYVLNRGIYPSYQLDRVLQGDRMTAQAALAYPMG